MTIRRIARGRNHSYTIDGAAVPGVTSVLSDGLAKPALIGWAARTIAEYVTDRLEEALEEGPDGPRDIISAQRLVDDLRTIRPHDGFSRARLTDALKVIHWQDRDQAARRGTEVHGYAEQLTAGIEVEVPDELVGHVDSYLRFLEEWAIRPSRAEATVASRRWNYAGTFDLLADSGRLPLGFALIDIKTGRSGIFPETCLQLAAYRHAEVLVDADGGEVEMPPIRDCYGLWVRSDGYDFMRLRADEAAFRLFLYCKALAEFAHDERDEWISDALTPPTSVEASA